MMSESLIDNFHHINQKYSAYRAEDFPKIIFSNGLEYILSERLQEQKSVSVSEMYYLNRLAFSLFIMNAFVLS